MTSSGPPSTNIYRDTFMDNGLEPLDSNHFVLTDTECTICHEDTSNIDARVVKTKHLDHRRGTCPVCRRILYRAGATGGMALDHDHDADADNDNYESSYNEIRARHFISMRSRTAPTDHLIHRPGPWQDLYLSSDRARGEGLRRAFQHTTESRHTHSGNGFTTRSNITRPTSRDPNGQADQTSAPTGLRLRGTTIRLPNSSRVAREMRDDVNVASRSRLPSPTEMLRSLSLVGAQGSNSPTTTSLALRNRILEATDNIPSDSPRGNARMQRRLRRVEQIRNGRLTRPDLPATLSSGSADRKCDAGFTTSYSSLAERIACPNDPQALSDALGQMVVVHLTNCYRSLLRLPIRSSREPMVRDVF
ncbi:hypothetical protein BDV96DRAFT_628592 [Lophiotrema nucula]|uniref:Uncharacterized protein n=1 Tax=Lophiotrema nucula TaxID=690887 RepID=A0A6A5ZKY3_9PLEO|nr:hypothetical protein BDV96DRAFT_628592 [Lophiotrema nucula]